MKQMRPGFTMVEMIIVIGVIGFILTMSLKVLPMLSENSDKIKMIATFKWAEAAYAETKQELQYSLPVSEGDTMACFDFKGGEDMNDNNLGHLYADAAPSIDSAVGANEDTINYYYKGFDKSFRSKLIQQLEFKSSSNTNNSGGIYIPSNPMSKIMLCGRGESRFLIFTNVKGSVALNVLSAFNKGKPTLADGITGNSRISLWTSNINNFISSSMSLDHQSKVNEPNYAKSADTGDGVNTPYTDEKVIEKKPAITVSFTLNRLSGGW